MKFNKNFSIIVLYNDDLEIFIQDRTSISKRGEEWGFFGGGLEYGEDFEQALIRETKEELNIDITGEYKYIGSTLFSLEGSGNQETRIYIVKYDNNKHRSLTVLEGDGGKFTTLNDFINMKITPQNHIGIEILKVYFNKSTNN